MYPSQTPRWLVLAATFVATYACMQTLVHIPTVLAAPALPPGTNQVAEKGAAPSGDDTSPPPGIDLGKLDEFERKVFYRVVNRESSACGKGHSLIYSVKHDSACRTSFYAVRYVAHLVDSGFTDSEIGEKLEKRFRTPRHPRIDVSTAPLKGNASGRVTVVEFVDYECPHCKHAQTLLRQVVEEYPGDVKTYFKHFPLNSHTNARLAAEGAVAAQKQGKFWPFNEKVWANSDNLTPAVLEKAAKEVGLDLPRWRTDMDSDAVKARVQSDKSEGNDLGIMATPSIYINGRKYDDPLEIASFRDWINEELGR
jgi:predicted DsbA family dithiol-disulfide isomerase